MVMSSLPFVVSIVSPALLIAIAFDALRARRVRPVDAALWVVMAMALVVVMVYPALIDILQARFGISIPVGVVSFVGIAAAFVGYARQSARVRKLEETLRELQSARDDGDGSRAVLETMPTARVDQERSARSDGSTEGG